QQAALLMILVVAVLTMIAPADTSWAQQTNEAGLVAPEIEFADEDRSLWDRWSDFIIDFQRRANAEVAVHMNAIERGDDLGAFFLGLGIAFLYGVIHAFGPGHGKFIIVSYFLGRDVNIGRGVLMAIQVAVVHVIAAVVIVWLADILLQAGAGMSLAEVPGVRAASFLIIAAIGLYMLYQALRAALGYIDPGEVGHGHSHSGGAHSHSHAHGGAQSNAPSQMARGEGAGVVKASRAESGLMALAAGVVPCPGAVLIMLFAVANNMIYPGFLLVGAMSIGIGLTICLLGVGAILARQTATRVIADADGGGARVVMLRHILNFGGAIFVTIIGVVSFIAFLDIPMASP
ncbi:MAG: hypothetical protein AAF401_11890, partial [Pseudomonadota bacterium]